MIRPPEIPAPPLPTDNEERGRVQHTRIRRQMLDGRHKQVIEARRTEHIGRQKSYHHGPVDMSANPFRVLYRELSVLYDEPPQVHHDAEADLAGLLGTEGSLALSGLWSTMARFQTWVLGCREYLLRPHVSADGDLRFRPVAPDMVTATSHEDSPDQPVSVSELRLRRHPDRDEWIWTRDVLDISDPAFPVYQITDAKAEEPIDLTIAYLGEPMSGDLYPYRKADGTPVLPYVLYHAERLGDRLWDPYEGIEIVEGSLNLASALSFWFHALQQASWPQRYLVNCTPAGLSTSASGSNEYVADPASVLLLTANDDGLQPVVGQWGPGANVEMLGKAIDQYAARLAHTAGIRVGDIQRVSANARSGYAIAMTNDGKIQAQRRFTPQFQYADQNLIGLAAIMLNRATGTAYPESGYRVAYRQARLGGAELKQRREHVLEMVKEGLMSRVQAYMLINPGTSEAQATAELQRIAGQLLTF